MRNCFLLLVLFFLNCHKIWSPFWSTIWFLTGGFHYGMGRPAREGDLLQLLFEWTHYVVSLLASARIQCSHHVTPFNWNFGQSWPPCPLPQPLGTTILVCPSEFHVNKTTWYLWYTPGLLHLMQCYWPSFTSRMTRLPSLNDWIMFFVWEDTCKCIYHLWFIHLSIDSNHDPTSCVWWRTTRRTQMMSFWCIVFISLWDKCTQ